MEISSIFLDLIPYLIPLLMIGVGTDLDIDSFKNLIVNKNCLLYTSPSPRDTLLSRMPSSA